MSLLAGVVLRRPGAIVPSGLRRNLEQVISRRAEDKPSVVESPSAHLVKLDIGAYGVPAHHVDEQGRCTIATGDPAVWAGSDWYAADRQSDLAWLHGEIALGKDTEALRAAMGTFSLVFADPSQHRFVVATDKLGMRALYFWVGDEMVIFASALRVLEEIRAVKKEMDTRAVAEKAGIGYFMADRTPYQDIFCLLPSEALIIDGQEVRRELYWKWEDVPQQDRLPAEQGAICYDRLSAAVRRRRGSDTAVLAFLSAGMDTRTVTSELVHQGAKLCTLNGAARGVLDFELARDWAGAVDADHLALPNAITDPHYPHDLATAWFEKKPRAKWQVTRPNLVWAGVGGSVGAGHPFLTRGLSADRELVKSLRAGPLEKALDNFCRQEGMILPPRLFQPHFRSFAAETVVRAFVEELARYPFKDPARAFYMVIVLNETRRSFHKNLQHIDLHRLDSVVPFNDARLIESYVEAPVDHCLGHRLYSEMIRPLASIFERAPWQTYRGHVPCLLPYPDGVLHQHDEQQLRQRDNEQRRSVIAEGFGALWRGPLPAFISRAGLAAALFAYTLGIRNTGYYAQIAGVFRAALKGRWP